MATTNKTSVDFAKGIRLRIPLARYDEARTAFRFVKEHALLVTVEDAAEQRRLWQTIQRAIRDGEWRNERHPRGAPVPDGDVADLPPSS